jgi:hypothetical protein
MTCPVCDELIPAGRRGQTGTYCSPACRKRAELDLRRLRKLERFVGGLGPVADRDEVLALLSAASRAGSVPAAQTLLRELPREPGDISETFVDELARRRTGREGA